jgi:hypothetical protein
MNEKECFKNRNKITFLKQFFIIISILIVKAKMCTILKVDEMVLALFSMLQHRLTFY